MSLIMCERRGGKCKFFTSVNRYNEIDKSFLYLRLYKRISVNRGAEGGNGRRRQGVYLVKCGTEVQARDSHE